MANIISAQNLAFSAAEYKIIMVLNNNLATPFLTLEDVSTNIVRDSESLYRIGQEEAYAVKRNAAKFSGSMTLQVGELSTMLRAAGLVEATQIEGATIAITTLSGLGMNIVFSNVVVNGQDISIKAKDKDTKVSLKWEAQSVSGITI